MPLKPQVVSDDITAANWTTFRATDEIQWKKFVDGVENLFEDAKWDVDSYISIPPYWTPVVASFLQRVVQLQNVKIIFIKEENCGVVVKYKYESPPTEMEKLVFVELIYDLENTIDSIVRRRALKQYNSNKRVENASVPT